MDWKEKDVNKRTNPFFPIHMWRSAELTFNYVYSMRKVQMSKKKTPQQFSLT